MKFPFVLRSTYDAQGAELAERSAHVAELSALGILWKKRAIRRKRKMEAAEKRMVELADTVLELSKDQKKDADTEASQEDPETTIVPRRPSIAGLKQRVAAATRKDKSS